MLAGIESGFRIILPQMHSGPAQSFSGVASASDQSASLRTSIRQDRVPKAWIAQGLLLGEDCAWFAPQHTTWSEVYMDLTEMLAPIVTASSRTPPVIRLSTGGRLDFWSLESSIPGRGRGYRRIVIDEAAFTKDGDNHDDDSMMALWEKGIKPTLYDDGGHALVCSNSAGKNPDNFFYNICNDPSYGFQEYHATTMENPLLPKRAAKESVEAWL